MQKVFLISLVCCLISCLPKERLIRFDGDISSQIVKVQNKKIIRLEFDKNSCRIFVPEEIQCDLKLLKSYLKEWASVEIGEVGNFVSEEKVAELMWETDNLRQKIEIFKSDDTCLLVNQIRDLESVKVKRSLVDFEKCKMLSNLEDQIRNKHLLDFRLKELSYHPKSGDKIQFTDKQIQLFLEIIANSEFVSFAYSGKIDSGQLKNFHIQEETNNNISGIFYLESDTGTKKLSFGRPKAGSPLTNVYFDGENQIRQFQILGWPKLRELILQK